MPTEPTRARVVNINREDCDVYIGRPSKWGNPYTLAGIGRKEAIQLYREHLVKHPELVAAAIGELAGKRLGCHCAPRACHGDILAHIANTRQLP